MVQLPDDSVGCVSDGLVWCVPDGSVSRWFGVFQMIQFPDGLV